MYKRIATLGVMLAFALPASATVTGNPPPAVYSPCNGTTTTYTIPFPYLAPSNIVATVTTGVVVAPLVLTTDYTVSPSVAPSVGTLKLVAGSRCPNGSTLTISRDVPLTQPTSFRTGPYSGSATEQAFDRIEMQLQQTSATHAADKITQAARDTAQDAALAAGSVGSSATMVLPTGATTARPLSTSTSDTAVVDSYGAVGDGTTDDSAAFNLALATGKTVRCRTGKTYAVGAVALVQSTAGQLIDMSGCTVKLANTAAFKGILRLNGAGARVSGGEWNMNSANNLSDTDSGYNTWAVLLAADRTVAEHMYIHDSYGIAIKGLAGVNHIAARFNRIVRTGVIANGVFAIYFDAPAGAGESFGNSVVGNYLDVSAVKEATAIGVFSATPVTTGQHRCLVQGNEVVGSVDPLTIGVGITVRGLDCVVNSNTVNGFTIGISVDPAQETRTIISSNHVKGATGASALGIESNGGRNVIVGNYVEGGKSGIQGSTQVQASASLDGVAVRGNTLKNQSVVGIFFQAAGGITAQHLAISGNTITNSTASAVAGIKLTGDCRYSHISGNTLDGPGGAVANSRGVYLDSVNSDITINGNRISNWERAATVFNAAAVAQDRIEFVGNDVASGLGNSSGSVLLSLEGAATWGAGTRVSDNWRGNAGSFVDDYLDRAGPVRFTEDNNFTTPESNVTAAIGSIYISAANGRLWTKIAGSGNTGWMGLTDRNTLTLSTGSGTAAVVGTFCTCTDTTAVAAVKCVVSAGTLTITGTGSDAITYICVK